MGSIIIYFFRNTRCKAILFSFLLFVPLEKLQSQSFDKIGFMGYFRSGFGLDSKGKSMSAFQAPNAESKYRLGNEAETYLETGFNYLMNSCYNISNNKFGIAVDGNSIYVQIDKGLGTKTELYSSFSDTKSWHTISVTYEGGTLSAILDEQPLSTNEEPLFSLPSSLGLNIAADTNQQNGLSGLVDNILLTDLTNTIAQYPLNTGEGSIAYDLGDSYNGSITNGEWILVT